jgi:hypothetical protein
VVATLAMAILLGGAAVVVTLQPGDRSPLVPLAAAIASAAEEAVEAHGSEADQPSTDASEPSSAAVGPRQEVEASPVAAASPDEAGATDDASVALTMTHVDEVGPDAGVSRPHPAPSRAEAEPRSSGSSRTRSGWVCDEAVRISDARSGRWSVRSISFRAMHGYERVILHLDREGSGSSGASAAGEVVANSAIRSFAPMAARPGAGRTTIGIELTGGIRSGLDLRSFRPQGLQTIRELSIYRAGPKARLLISVASDGCFRMRAPAWHPASAAGATGQLIVDVRP